MGRCNLLDIRRDLEQIRNNNNQTFGDKSLSIYLNQIEFQSMLGFEVIFPTDDLKMFTYHCLSLIEEIGELLQSDKRWKTHRKETFNLEEKKKEIADVFITVINIAIFSGIEFDELIKVIEDKQKENIERLLKEND